MPSSIVTSRLGGQEWRRTETPDAVGVRARRWGLRLGLVLAAGAAGMAVTAGAAQADSGLGGTLDHVTGTMQKVTGSSHSSGTHSSGSHASKASSGYHASSSPHRSGSVRVTVRRAPVRTVARPVLRTVQRAARPVVQQAVRKPSATTKTHPAKAPKAPKTHAKVQVKASALPTLRVDVLGLDLGVDLSRVDLPRMNLPRVDLPRVDLPRVDLPTVPLPSPTALPPVAAPTDRAPARTVRVAASTDRSTSVARNPTSPTSSSPLVPRHASIVGALRAAPAAVALSHVAATAGHLLLWSPRAATDDGSSAGLLPGGSAAGAGATGALLLGLAVSAGLAALRMAHGRTPDGLAPEAFRLPRQPGFAPD